MIHSPCEAAVNGKSSQMSAALPICWEVQGNPDGRMASPSITVPSLAQTPLMPV